MTPAAASTFSYAQAAKGVTSAPSSMHPSRVPSGSLTPAKEGFHLAPDVEKSGLANGVHTILQEKAASGFDHNNDRAVHSPFEGSTAVASNGLVSPTSPAFGASSTSTLLREDDTSSVPNPSSESTNWESKSQSSTQEKAFEDPEAAGTEEQDKSAKIEDKAPPKPVLYEAPLPSVNIWKQRAEEQKSKIVSVSTSTPVAPTEIKALPPASPARNHEARSSARGPTEDKPYRKNRERNSDEPSRRSRRSSLPGSREQDDRSPRSIPKTAPLPSMGDSESWPTPLTVQDGDRRRAQEKADKDSIKDRALASSQASKGKAGWVSVPITPTVVFNTQISTGSRRGGRGGGRGARDGGRRESTRGNGAGDRGDTSPTAQVNGDSIGRQVHTEESSRSASPSKGRRGPNDEQPRKESKAPAAEKGVMDTEELMNTRPAGAMVSPSDPAKGTDSYPSNVVQQRHAPRPKQSRRQEGSSSGEERFKDSDNVPNGRPTEYNSVQRRASFTQVEEYSDKQTPLNEAGAPRYQAADRRSGQFHSYPTRERQERGRGGVRRNGTHNFHGASAQQIASSFTPAHGYQNTRGGFRGSSRAHSIPTESTYARFGHTYPPQYLPQLQTAMPNGGMFDYANTYAMSAVPFDPFGQYHVVNMVVTQLEYYFSTENLIKDVYLRKHMDSQGFILLSFVASFNRLKSLSQDFELIKYACTISSNIEFRIGADGKDRARKREGWEKWVLPKPDRDHSAQNDGPGEVRYPPPAQSTSIDTGMLPRQFSLPAITSPVSAFPSLNGHPYMAPSPPGQEEINGLGLHTSPTSMFQDQHQRISPLQAGHDVQDLHAVNESEADNFSDAQVNMLTVVWRQPEPEPLEQSQPKREESNASGVQPVSSKTLVNGTSGAQEKEQQSEKPVVQVNASNTPLGRRSPPQTGNASGPSVGVYWLEHKESPSQELPPNTTSELYVDLRAQALQLRSHAKSGVLPHDMELLYQFWSHFLVRNFNTSMYNEFRNLALEDAARGINTGFVHLTKYYGAALKKMDPLRSRLARHYVQLAKSETEPEQPVFKQLRAAWRDGALNIQNRKRIIPFIDAEFRKQLDG